MKGCQRIRETIKERLRNLPDILLPLSLLLALPPLHYSSIKGDTLVAAGQSSLTLSLRMRDGPFLSSHLTMDKWQVMGITQTRGVKLQM